MTKILVIEKVGGANTAPVKVGDTVVSIVVPMCWASTQRDLNSLALGIAISSGQKLDKNVRYVGIPGPKAVEVEGKWYVSQGGECLLATKKQSLEALKKTKASPDLILQVENKIAEIERVLTILKSRPATASV